MRRKGGVMEHGGTSAARTKGTLMGELQRWEPDAARSARTALEHLGTVRVHDRGDTLIMEGARSRYVLLLGGFAKVLTAERSGTAVLTDIRAAGDVVGETAAFCDEPRSATVVAAERLAVRRIGQDEWLHWVSRHPVAGLAISGSLAHRSRVATRRLTTFGRGPVIARLASAILDLGERYGERASGGLLVKPALTQGEWGELIGAGERRVHHALHELCTAGTLTLTRRQIVVHALAPLQEIAAQEEPPC